MHVQPRIPNCWFGRAGAAPPPSPLRIGCRPRLSHPLLPFGDALCISGLPVAFPCFPIIPSIYYYPLPTGWPSLCLSVTHHGFSCRPLPSCQQSFKVSFTAEMMAVTETNPKQCPSPLPLFLPSAVSECRMSLDTESPRCTNIPGRSQKADTE